MTGASLGVRMVDVDCSVLSNWAFEAAQNRFPKGHFMKHVEIISSVYLDGESREGGGRIVRRN